MINQLPKIIIRFVLLVFIQVLVLNHINIFGLVSPHLYVLFILSLPLELSKSRVLLISFFTGLVIDVFGNSYGIHATACIVTGYFRHFLLMLIAPREGYEQGLKPNVSYMGWSWYLPYALILIFIHHFSLYFIEYFRFDGISITIKRVILSFLFTGLLVVLTQLVNPKKARSI